MNFILSIKQNYEGSKSPCQVYSQFFCDMTISKSFPNEVPNSISFVLQGETISRPMVIFMNDLMFIDSSKCIINVW